MKIPYVIDNQTQTSAMEEKEIQVGLFRVSIPRFDKRAC